jgi:hypothetical protein
MMGYTIQMPCPPRHQITALFEEIRPTVGSLDLIGQFVRKCLVCNFFREIGFLGNPIGEGGTETVNGHTLDAAIAQQFSHGHIAHGLFAVSGKHQSGIVSAFIPAPA